MNTSVLFERVRSAEYEYRAAQLAVARLRQEAVRDPTVLRRTNIEPRRVRQCFGNLDRTYVVRIFAEFETGLRAFWKATRSKHTWPRVGAERLINQIAARQSIPTDRLTDVHRVRDFRNELLHTGSPEITFTLEECRSKLCKFLSFLPHEW